MSLLEKYTKGWTFRTARPTFEEGEEITVMVTGREGDTPVARVGDSILRIPEAPASTVDRRVRIRVDEFDENDHVGSASLLSVVGEATF